MKYSFLLLFLLSCQNYNSNSSDKEKYGPVALESNAQFQASYKIIQNRCVNCHTSQIHAPWAEYTTNAKWVQSGLVVKGDPQNSDLISRIINSGETDSNMPQGGSALPNDEYDTLVQWVQNIPMKTLSLFFLLFMTTGAWGYANFIGHSYTSCMNCHFNPFGGGPLNDYGRVISATAISSRALYPKSWDEEKIAYTSGFLFRKPKQDWLRTQINYRGFQLVRNPGSSNSEVKQWINMQADARVILKFGENDKFIAVGNFGYAPRPMPTPPGDEQPEWRSREHYMGYRITPKVGVYAGLMDKVYGLRVIEHIAYSRTTPQVTQNDQVHGVTTHFLGEKWEGGVQGFVGNLGQDKDIRMKGVTSMFERTVFDYHRLGASFQKAENDYLKLTSYAGHARLNLKEGAALLGEIGQTKRETDNATDDRTARYGLLQTYLRPLKGLYVLANIEYSKRDIKRDDYSVRWGPGVQYFPIQRIELRFDIYDTRNFAPNSSNKDTWMYLLQTHLWL